MMEHSTIFLRMANWEARVYTRIKSKMHGTFYGEMKRGKRKKEKEEE